MNSHLSLIHNIPNTFMDILSAWDSDTVLLIILLLLLVIWLFPEKSSPAEDLDKKNQSTTSDDTAYDYDFLASHESTDAQFDLVIAYAAMDHKEKALSLLEELHRSTHASTRARAQKMLDTLKSKWNIS